MNDYSYYMKLYFSLAIRYSTIFATELQHSCYIAPNHYQQQSCIFVFTNNSKIWYLFKCKC